MSTARYITPQSLAGIGSTKLRARNVLEGVLAGMHRSPHRGASVEFAEYKEYSPGDEIRHIDWRAWGRTDRYYVKQYEDETNTRGFLLLDGSGSMDFASEGLPTKWTWASTLVATLAWLLLRQGDAPGLLVFGERPGAWLVPSSRRTQLDDLCRLLDAREVRGGTNTEAALRQIAERTRFRSIVVLVSDMLDPASEALRVGRILRRRGVEVALFHVLDPAELTLPWEGLARFEGLEGEGDLLVDPDDIRHAYLETMGRHLASIEEDCRRGDLEYFRVRTDQPVEEAVLRFLRARARGSKTGGRR
ncbi:MAG: DUF58 domain-containing protein [Deltaproteobacteria bacterium]|nr:MAG: DUF58 domain-containing protein [Deltaproteobacteria bacterium]